MSNLNPSGGGGGGGRALVFICEMDCYAAIGGTNISFALLSLSGRCVCRDLGYGGEERKRQERRLARDYSLDKTRPVVDAARPLM